jgi:hypothetical protein
VVGGSVWPGEPGRRDLPIVAANANSGNPHYEPHARGSAGVKAGDFMLLDIWEEEHAQRGLLRHYLDRRDQDAIGKQVEIFNIVSRARDAGIKK